MNNAPIVLFTYKRLDTLKSCLDSLRQNFMAADSDLYIFSDGPKNNSDELLVLEVRNYLKQVHGFRKISIIESPNNKGLAKSIINGVSEIIEKYGRVIVIEDDLILSKNFLNFMNQSLDHYSTVNQYFSISGFCPKISKYGKDSSDSFAYGRAHSWGWATWKDRWNTVDWEVSDWNELEKDKNRQEEFNKYGSDLYDMLKGYKEKRNNSWYVRFTYSQQKQSRLTAYPIRSKVINNGFTEDATHCNTYNRVRVDFDNSLTTKFNLTNDIVINPFYFKQLYRLKSLSYRAVSKVLTQLLKIGLIKQRIETF